MSDNPCTSCNGKGGTTVDASTVENGHTITRQNWESCQGCNGTGVAGGGH